MGLRAWLGGMGRGRVSPAPAAGLVASALLCLGLAACGGPDPPDEAPAAKATPGEPAAAAQVCPPCRMAVRPEYEVLELDGLRFAVCNPRCGEIVSADPARFAADALP